MSASPSSPKNQPGSRAGWAWVPTLYVAESLPYALVNLFAIPFFTLRGIPLHQVAFWTSLLGLPWVLKPLWSPLLEGTRRLPAAIVAAQFFIGALFATTAMLTDTDQWFFACVGLFAVIGIFSATHDALIDGFYIRTLSPDRQAFFSGVRNTFYRIGLLLGGSLLLILQERLSKNTLFSETPGVSWAVVFALAGIFIILLAAYHTFALRGNTVLAPCAAAPASPHYWQVIITFFQKPGIIGMLAFMLLYRFAEALLIKVTPMFMLLPRDQGGLGLNQTQYSLIYGTLGLIALLVGGLFGGWLVSQKGLRTCFWPMALALNVPDLVYVYLAYARPESLSPVALCVGIEQFGYGFGFTAFMVYLLYAARGPYAIAHYALCTAFMALGVVLPGVFSGFLAEELGFTGFFTLVCALTTVSFFAVKIAPLRENFGKGSAAL